MFLVIQAFLVHQAAQAFKEHLGLQDPRDHKVIRVYRVNRALLGQLDCKDLRVHPDLGEIQARWEAQDLWEPRVNQEDKDQKAILVLMGTQDLRDPQARQEPRVLRVI